MWSLKLSALIINLIVLCNLINFSNGKSLQKRLDNKMSDFSSILIQSKNPSNIPSILKELNKDESKKDQIKQDKMNFLNFNNQLNNQVADLSPSSSNNDLVVSSNSGSSDEVINILRGSLAKLPGESMGKLIDKRSTFLNISSIEQLLELETNSVDVSKDEPGCYIEIRIIKRIPGRCAIVDGEPVCRADNYYKKNDECLTL